MVNTGQPSEACFQCRTRRIKCDLTKPQCHRCSKVGIQCPGYPDKPTLVIQDDTTKTRARAQRMYQALNKPRSQSQPRLSAESSSGNNSTESGITDLVLSKDDTIELPPMDKAFDLTPLSFFKDTLVAGSVGKFIGEWTEDSAKLFASLRSISNLYPDCLPCVSAAIETMSLWVLSISECGISADVDSSVKRMYGVCLSEINQMIQRIDEISEEQVDQLLVAIELMALFEGFAQFDQHEDVTNRVSIHAQGVFAIMRKRGAGQFKTGIGRQTFVDVFNLYVAGTIVKTKPNKLPILLNTLDVLLESQPNAGNIPEYSVLPLLNRSLLLRRSAADILDSVLPLGSAASTASSEATPVLALQHDAHQLFQDFTTWYAELSSTRKSSTHPNDRYCTNISCVHQILVQDILVRSYHRLNHLEATPHGREEEIALCVSIASSLVDRICASLPFAFAEQDLSKAFSRPRSGAQIMHNITFSHPLLVCSMVNGLTDAKQLGIAFARKACAEATGLQQPLRTYPKNLVLAAPDLDTTPFLWTETDPAARRRDLDVDMQRTSLSLGEA